MKKISLITVILLICAMVTSISAQQGRGRGAGRQMGFNIDRLTQELELTDAQAAQIQQMHYEIQKADIDLKSSMEKNRLEIHNMVANNEIVDSEILNLASNNSNLMSAMKTNKIQLWLDIYKILNAEQQVKWTKHFQRMGNGRDRAGDGRMRKERFREQDPDKQERGR
jgi:Spy/CpxP family protein refolding chaperone